MADITLPQPTSVVTANSTPTGVSTSTPLMSPAVVTSKAATDDINNIQAKHSEIVTGINNQATVAANAKAKSDADAAAKATTDTAAKAAIDKQNADAKTAAVTGTPPATTAPTTMTDAQVRSIAGNDFTGFQQQADGTYIADDYAKNKYGIGKTSSIEGDSLAKAQADYQAQAKVVQDTITNIQNGTIPLNAGQLAQVEGLKQQFQQLIDQQVLTNTGASGVANIRGYQTGAAEYDPTFQAKTIGSIITSGLNKVADLNIKMSSAVAKLTQAFQDDDIKAVKDAWSVYQDASKTRTDALQKTIDDTQKAIKTAQDLKEKQEKDVYDRVTKPIDDILKDAAKNGASQDILDKIRAAKTPDEAIATAGDWLQTGTGSVGEWLAYKHEEQKAGRTPMGLNSYMTLDANRKLSLAKAGTVSDKKANAYGSINQLLGAKNSEGMPYLDQQGFFTAKGFKDIVLNAAEDNITRKDILEQYASYLSPYNPQGYGLTDKEIKDYISTPK